MIVLAWMMILLQIAICAVLLIPGSRPHGSNFFVTALSLAAVLAFVVFFYFITPQIYGATREFFILAPEATTHHRKTQVFLSTQLTFLLFFAALSTPIIFSKFRASEPCSSKIAQLDSTDIRILILLFIFGSGGLLYLDFMSFSISGFRSELVKTWDGKLATSISFFANFAFAMIFSHLIVGRKFIMAIALTTAFGTMILLTGARGRFLWPLLFGVLGSFVISGKGNARAFIATSCAIFVVLLLMDPLRAALLGDRPFQFDFLDEISAVYKRRTFDGFSNLALILHGDQISSDLGNIVTGTRVAFMEAYFPETFRAGVGFGSTIPGYFYLSGGFVGLIIGGLVLGSFFSVIQILIARTENLWLVFSYLFAASWLTAIAGNLVESLDKLIAASFPGILGYYLTKALRNNARTHTDYIRPTIDGSP